MNHSSIACGGSCPRKLVEIVLKRVPFESLVRFRAVCKRFNSLITLPKFVRECQTQQAWKPVPLIVDYLIDLDFCSIEIFNSQTNSWLTHPLPILEANLYPLHLTAATGGLLCFDTKDYRKTLVCNPLTGAFKLLACPNLPDSNDYFDFYRLLTGLVVDHQAGTFTLVVVIGTKSEAYGTFLYDSAVGSWRLGASLPNAWYMSYTLTLTSNESMYGVVASSKNTLKLVKYDVRNDNWSEISVASSVHEHVVIKEHRRQVVVVVTATNLRPWLVGNEADFARTIYTVRKAATGHGETLVEEGVVRGVIPGQEEPRNVESLFHGWDKNFGDFDTTEIGDGIFVTRCADPVIEAQHMHRAMQVLPKAGSRCAFEIKLLEPSLVAV